LHAAAVLALVENDPLPAILEANVEIFFFTRSLWQLGQMTSPTALELKTNSSKVVLQF
jgi:hypothetical protein